MSIGTEAGASVERAVRFLEERQLESGEFTVFASRDREMAKDCAPDASVFPTALIAHSLSFCARAARIRECAVQFLVAQMDAYGLWRHWTTAHPHCAQLPPDLDDTCCASAALTASGMHFPQNVELILANRDRRGLFYTWVVPRPRWTTAAHMKVTLAQLRRAPTLLVFFRRTSAAPYDVDAVVNANCLFYLGDGAHAKAVIDHLRGVLLSDGETRCDKWYDDPFVVWYFFARALGGTAPDVAAMVREKVGGAQPATPLHKALAVCTLLYTGGAHDEAIAAVLDSQLPNGAWPRGALYHGGRARTRADGYAAPHPDTPHWGSEELTTALSIEALARWQQQASARQDGRGVSCNAR